MASEPLDLSGQRQAALYPSFKSCKSWPHCLHTFEILRLAELFLQPGLFLHLLVKRGIGLLAFRSSVLDSSFKLFVCRR